MLEFKVIEQQLIRTDSFKPVADSVNYLEVKFDLTDSDFDGITTAIFEPLYDGDTYEQVLVDDTCLVPWEVIKAKGFDVSLFCIIDGKRITTNPVTVRVVESGYKEGKTPCEPTPDVYSQILEKFELSHGKSAYELAVENGFVGTEQEWLDSLKGKSAEILDYSITTSKLANKSVTLDKIADGIIPDIENIKMLFFINNENDFNTAYSKLFDDEGNIILSQGESAILIISQNLDEVGLEKGIVCVDSEGNANYVTTTVDDLKKYLTKSDIKPMFDNLKYKLVFSTTITKEVAYVLQGGLKLKDAFVVVYGKGSENNDGINATTIFSVASNSQALTNCSKLSAGYSVFGVSDNVNYFEANVLGNKIKTIASNRYSPTEIRRVLNGCENIVDGDYIQSIMVGSSVSNAVLGVGTKIEIWGIEADEG